MSDVLVPFVYELRRRKLKVGPGELLALAKALAHDLHDSSLDGFYYVARAVLVHREQDLDAFDQAFSTHFKGAVAHSVTVQDTILDWLSDPRKMAELTPEERDALSHLDMEEVRRYNFVEAWPVSWEGPSFAANGAEIAVESIEIAHNGIQVT